MRIFGGFYWKANLDGGISGSDYKHKTEILPDWGVLF